MPRKRFGGRLRLEELPHVSILVYGKAIVSGRGKRPISDALIKMQDGTLLHVAGEECRLGGQRAFLICPRCGHRRLALFQHPLHGWGCRGCLHLVHSSTREGEYDRMMRAHDVLLRKMGGDEEKRPAGMHWGTWEKLQDAYGEWETRWQECIIRRLRLGEHSSARA